MEVASAVRTSSLDFAELSNLANQGVMFAPTTYGMTRSDKTGWQETCTSNDVVLRDWIRQGYSLVTVAKRGHSFAIDIDDFAACIAMGFKPEWLGGLYLVDTPSGGIHAHGLHTPETEGFSSKSVINVYRVKGNAKSGLALELKLDHASVAAPTAPRTNQPKKKDGVPSSKLGRGIHPELLAWIKEHAENTEAKEYREKFAGFHSEFELERFLENEDCTLHASGMVDGAFHVIVDSCPHSGKHHNNSTVRAGITKFIFGGRSYGFICHACGIDSREEHETLMAEQTDYEPWVEPIYQQANPANFLNQDEPADSLGRVYPLTDMGNAERFEQRFASAFIWTKETGWQAYRDGVWEEDKTAEADQAMQVTVRLITQEAELVGGDDEAAENMCDAIIGWAKQSESNAKIKAALERASKLKAFARSYGDFDRHPNLFNCANGTIDLNTMEFRKHDPNDLLTKVSPISYSPDAQCPQWEKFVLEVMDSKEHMMRYLQRWMGYTMTANTGEQCMAVPYGRGGTGKSTFLHVLAGVLGDYAKTADAEMLMVKRGDAGQPFEMAGLEGRRLLFAIETEEAKTLATAKVKRMTGQDPMKACYKFQNPFEFVPVWKIWQATNDQPNVRALDDAYWDRVKVIPFTVKFRDTEKQVRDLDEKLLAEEGSGILNWCVAGCQEWKRIGLQHPEEVNIAVKEWREREDYLARFLEEHTEATDKPAEFVQRSKLFESFSRWAEETKEGRGLKEKTFVEDMKRKGYIPGSIKQGGKTVGVWLGVKLVSVLSEYGAQMRPEDVI